MKKSIGFGLNLMCNGLRQFSSNGSDRTGMMPGVVEWLLSPMKFDWHLKGLCAHASRPSERTPQTANDAAPPLSEAFQKYGRLQTMRSQKATGPAHSKATRAILHPPTTRDKCLIV